MSEDKKAVRGGKYERPECRYCGALTRRKFAAGDGKGSRLQHSKWRVCPNGHQGVYKRGQRG